MNHAPRMGHAPTGLPPSQKRKLRRSACHVWSINRTLTVSKRRLTLMLPVLLLMMTTLRPKPIAHQMKTMNVQWTPVCRQVDGLKRWSLRHVFFSRQITVSWLNPLTFQRPSWTPPSSNNSRGTEQGDVKDSSTVMPDNAMIRPASCTPFQSAGQGTYSDFIGECTNFIDGKLLLY